MASKQYKTGDIVKTRDKGERYEIQYVVHSNTLGSDVYCCYRLSHYDGMPIGPKVWISASDVLLEE